MRRTAYGKLALKAPALYCGVRLEPKDGGCAAEPQDKSEKGAARALDVLDACLLAAVADARGLKAARAFARDRGRSVAFRRLRLPDPKGREAALYFFARALEEDRKPRSTALLYQCVKALGGAAQAAYREGMPQQARDALAHAAEALRWEEEDGPGAPDPRLDAVDTDAHLAALLRALYEG